MASATLTRTQLVDKARVYLSGGFEDDPAGLAAKIAEEHGIDRDEAAGIVAEADRSTAERPHNTDAGNAARLAEQHGDRIRYLYEHRMWLAWDGTRWAPDATGAVERYAKETVRRIYVEAAAIPGDDDRKAAMKWAMASENAARLEAMMKLARSDEEDRRPGSRP